MITAHTKRGSTLLKCCLCGECDYEKLYVHQLGLGLGMNGDDYTFCEKCWKSRTLGKKILQLLDYPHGAILNEDCLVLREVEQ